MKNELNPRQWALYNLLKNNPDRYWTQIEIAYRLRDFYDTSFYNDQFHDSAARHMITKDIRAINKSDIIQKIIISNSRGVKIASSAEFEQYINAEFASIFRKLARTRQKARKAGLDGQMRIVLGNERDTIEAFADSINRLKAARLNAGLKLADVARELCAAGEKGIDVSLLSKMENGYCRPTDSVLLKLTALYGVEARFLLDDKTPATDGETA
jgi:ribosome-binding protein aMBF1 (putative translation factor)